MTTGDNYMSEVTYAHHGKVVLGLPDIAPTLAQGAAVRRGSFQALPSRGDNANMSEPSEVFEPFLDLSVASGSL